MKLKALLSLALLLLTSCGSREEGIRLPLWLAHRAQQGEARLEGGAREFTGSQGERILLTRAYVTLDSVELFPCPESGAWRWLRELSPIGTAHAHSESSPLRLGTPHVSSLERPDNEPLALGTLRPPPGRYCRVHLVFGPADADAEGLPTSEDMKGRTLLLEGELQPASGGSTYSFRLESRGVAHADLPLDGLSLSAEELVSEHLITLAYDHWLDGVSPQATDAAAQALRNVADSAALSAMP